MDPSERFNIADMHPEIIAEIRSLLEELQEGVHKKNLIHWFKIIYCVINISFHADFILSIIYFLNEHSGTSSEPGLILYMPSFLLHLIHPTESGLSQKGPPEH